MNLISCEVISSEKLKNFIKVQYIEPGGTRGSDRLTAIRGGIAWPTDNSPFYVCILGQPRPDEYEAESLRSPSFEVLYEKTFKGFDSEERYSALGDIAELYCCDFYCDYSSEKHQASKDSFYDYRTKHPQTFGDLAPSFYQSSLRVGVELLKTWVSQRKIIIPETTELFSQVSRITQNDLADGKARERFFAVEALRHAATSFSRDPASEGETAEGMYTKPGESQGWML